MRIFLLQQITDSGKSYDRVVAFEDKKDLVNFILEVEATGSRIVIKKEIKKDE